MSGRLAAIPLDDMTSAQQKLFESITGGERGRKSDPSEFLNEDGALRGPFNALLLAPELGELVQRVGEKVRFGTTLPGTIRELAILTCAHHWKSNYEWFAHARIARAEGVSEEAIARVLAGDAPMESDLCVVHEFIKKLNDTGRVDDPTYEAAKTLLEEEGVAELTVLSGYYALIAHVLNVFQVSVPTGEPVPFPD